MLHELTWNRWQALLSLRNGDTLQLIKSAEEYHVFQIDELHNRNRRAWWHIDALTAQCILNALLQDPLMQLSDHPER